MAFPSSASPTNLDPTPQQDSLDAIKSGLRQRLTSDISAQEASAARRGRDRKSSAASSIFSVSSNLPAAGRARQDSTASSNAPQRSTPKKLQKRRQPTVYSDAQDSFLIPQQERQRDSSTGPNRAEIEESSIFVDEQALQRVPSTSSAWSPAHSPNNALSLDRVARSGADAASMRAQISPRPAASDLEPSSPEAPKRLILKHGDSDEYSLPRSPQCVDTYSWASLVHWLLSSPVYLPLRLISFVPVVRRFSVGV